MDRLRSTLAYILRLDIHLKLNVNGKKVNYFLVLLLLLLGVKQLIDILRKYVLSIIWETVESGWKGGMQ